MSFITNVKRQVYLARQIFPFYRWQIFLILFLGLVSSVLETFGIGILIPIFSFVSGQGLKGGDFMTQNVVNLFRLLNIDHIGYALIILLALLFITKQFFLFTAGYIKVRMLTDYENSISQRMYRQTLIANWPFLMRHKLGHLENLLVAQAKSCARFLMFVADFMMRIMSFAVYTLFALKLSPFITSMAVGIGVIILICSRPLIRKVKYYGQEQAMLGQNIAHEINENIIGIKTIKALAVEPEASRKGARLFDRYNRGKVRLYLLKEINSAPIQPLSIIFTASMFSFSYLYQKSAFDISVFAVVIFLIERIFTYVENIQGMLHQLNSLTPYVENFYRFSEEVQANQEREEGTRNFSFEKEISIEHLSFTYAEKSRLLRDISVSVRKGQMLGIIGPSGAGKTTFVDLILRLFEPTGGRILIDGVDIREIKLRDWRRHVGYVSQDVYLKNVSIRDNIRFYDENITDETIIESARKSYILDFIQSLPQGFETVVGERGVRLSGGQKQRIVLARALARKSEILILDEATSVLDNEAEVLIRKAIESLRGSITMIIIAHRIPAVIQADNLVVIKDGRIIEQGIPRELLKDTASYFYKVRELS